MMKRLHPVARVLLPAWAVLLVGALTHPLLAPGELALRDMLVLSRPALSPAALGVGDLPARNAPQDGLLALAGALVDASWLARLLLVAAGFTGALGAWWLVAVVRDRQAPQRTGHARRTRPRVPAWPIAAGMTIAVYNPFVVERLLQGQWSLVIAAWCLPLIAAAGLSARPLAGAAGIVAASLTPTGALLATATGVVAGRGARTRLILGAVGAAASMPWVIPGFLHPGTGTSLAHAAAVFGPRAEQFVGTAGALAGLGGIWNAEAVPASRHAGFAVFGVVLFVVLLTAWRRCPPRLLVLAGAGFAVVLLAWLVPELAGWVVSTVPGGGLLRDSQKVVMLAIPAYVVLAGSLKRGWAAAALGLALLQVPDAPVALQQLRPVAIRTDEELIARADGRDVLFLDRGPLTRRADGAVIIEPHTKALSAVESGELVVDGTRTDLPTRRYTAAVDAFRAGDLDKLTRLQVGLVVTENGDIVETGAPPRDRTGGVLLLLWWLAVGAVVALSAIWSARRR